MLQQHAADVARHRQQLSAELQQMLLPITAAARPAARQQEAQAAQQLECQIRASNALELRLRAVSQRTFDILMSTAAEEDF